MTSILDAWLSSLLDISIKAGLLAAVGGAGLWALRVRNSNVQHRVWSVVLLGMLLLPLLVSITPQIPLPAWLYPQWRPAGEYAAPIRMDSQSFVPASAEVTISQEDTRPRAASATIAPPSEAPTASIFQERRPTAFAMPNGSTLLMAVYVAGVAVFVGRLLVGLSRARQLVRSAEPISLSPAHARLVGKTTVIASPLLRVPLTVGWVCPRIVLPADWLSWKESLLVAVLAHEQSHVRRGDPWVTLLAEWNRALYWFHPVAWLVRRRLTTLAEQICDDAVVEQFDDRTGYAWHLLDMARRLAGRKQRLEAVGVAMIRQTRVERRIDAILDADRPLARRLGVAGGLAMAAIAVPLVLLAAGLKADESGSIGGSVKPDAAAAFEDPPIDQGKPQLRGRVVMAADGKPVAGADIRLMTCDEDGCRFAVERAKSDEQGEFAFARLPEGNNRVLAYFKDFSSRQARYKGETVKLADDGKSYEPVTLKLSRSPHIVVRVVDKANGKPIENAAVELVWSDGVGGERTDEAGSTVLHGLTHEEWHVKVRAKGFAQQVQAVNLSDANEAELSFKLEPGGALYGTVVDETGAPVPDAGFCVFPANLAGEQIDYVETDEAGRYRFDNLPLDQNLETIVLKVGFIDSRQQTGLAGATDDERKLDVVLRRRPDGGSVQGTVRDEAGKPIAGARITNRGGSSREARTATTDASGKFRLDDVYEGSVGHELTVRAHRHAPQRMAFKPGSRENPADIAVVMRPGHRLRGRVVNEEGKPVARAYVYHSHANEAPYEDIGGDARTDAEGRFEFDSLPEKPPFTFIAEGYSEIEETFLSLDGDDEVVVTMQTQGVIRGHVADAKTEQPISSFGVRVTFSPDRRPGEPGRHLVGGAWMSPDGERFSNPDGDFALKGLIRGMPLQVTVQAEGYDRQTVRRVVAGAENDVDPVEFRLTPMSSKNMLAIRGHMLDEKSRPVAGANLRLIVASERPFPRERYPFYWYMIRSGQLGETAEVKQFLSGTTDQEGAFVFENVRADADIELAYWGEGVSAGRLAHLEKLSEEYRQDVKIVAIAPGAVRGSVDRKALPDVTGIELSSLDHPYDYGHGNKPLAQGEMSYEIRNVPPGKYQLRVVGEPVQLEGHRGAFTHEILQRHTIEVQSGKTVTFDFEAGEEESGGPVNRLAEQFAAALSGKAGDKTEESGPRSGKQKSAETSPAAHPAPPQEAPVNRKLLGSVVDEAGQPVAGARLWLPIKHSPQQKEECLVQATTEEEGTFVLNVPARWLEPRTLMPHSIVWCYSPGHRIATASIYRSLIEGSDEPLAIKLLPETDTSFVVTDAGGQPVRGAKVEPWHFEVVETNYEMVPDELREIISGVTDEQGRAALPTMERDGLSRVCITAETYGTQLSRLEDSDKEPAERKIVLRETGRLSGRLVFDDPKAVSNVDVHISENPWNRQDTAGMAKTQTDDEGRFSVGEFAEGQVTLWISTDKSLPFRPQIPEKIKVEAGKTTEVDIPLEPAVRVRGVVRTKDDHAPISDSLVVVSYGSPGVYQAESVRSDAKGRFEAYVLPGEVRQQLIMRPRPFRLWAGDRTVPKEHIVVTAQETAFELPPIELVETFERTGKLVDQDERPVGDARITAEVRRRPLSMAKTKSDGSFSLWLPKAPSIDTFHVYPTPRSPREEATVLKEDPLILQVRR